MSSDCKSGFSYPGFIHSISWCLCVLEGESKMQLLTVVGAQSCSKVTSSG